MRQISELDKVTIAAALPVNTAALRVNTAALAVNAPVLPVNTAALRVVAAALPVIAAALSVIATPCVAWAQYATNFEVFAGDANGELLAPQDGWFTPAATPANTPYQVYTYAGNLFGFPANPQGGTKFAAARKGSGSPGGYGFAQHNNAWFSPDVWTITYDFAVGFDGTLPSANDVGAFSLQPAPESMYAAAVYSWDDPTTALTFSAYYARWDDIGTPSLETPGPAWENLRKYRWYRQQTVIDFAQKRYLSFSIKNLATGTESSVVPPSDWYLNEGPDFPHPRPTAFCLFTGGGASSGPAGNVMAWDNLSIVPGGGPCQPCDTNCDGSVNLFDIEGFTNLLVGTAEPCNVCGGDSNGDGTVNLFDIQGFVACLTP